MRIVATHSKYVSLEAFNIISTVSDTLLSVQFQLLLAVLMLASSVLADGFFDDDGPFGDDFEDFFGDDDNGGRFGLSGQRFFGRQRTFGGRPSFGHCGYYC